MKSTANKGRLILLVLILAASFLRLWRISEVPVSLFGDELDVGYHAYSFLKTGKDYSGNSLPMHFQSLAEWRTPLYLYSAVPTVALFGISPLGVRLPAAFFGILGVWGLYLLVKQISKDEKLALLSSAILAFSPWHIQYSRAAFEATELLAFLIFGLYFFFKSLPSDKKGLKSGKYLWISAVLLVFTPWIYSTAKLFTPLLLLFLFVVWKKELLTLPKRQLAKAVVAGFIVGVPIAYSTLLGGGSQRFDYISVFSDPTRETEIGYQRELDANVRGELVTGLQPTMSDKLFHNKLVFWGKRISNNIFQSLSPEFLFIKGDLNLRHSIEGIGQFYKLELVGLFFGIVLFFTSKIGKKMKWFIVFWLIAGIFPASITRNGGNHATRLILILPAFVVLISYGLSKSASLLKSKLIGKLLIFGYLGIWAFSFVFYQHNFWVHNPWYSERWWHSGFKEAIRSIKEVEDNYDKVIISMAGEPAWIFFAGWYEYPPEKWHADFPIGNDVELEGFGKVSHIDKFYFGSPQTDESFYSWGKIIDKGTLYLANTTEINVNLIKEPERTPPDLKLVKAIPFPSGEPAFYLFSGK